MAVQLIFPQRWELHRHRSSFKLSLLQMIVCSFSHTYSITIREASNIIQAGTTIITGQQASISLQGLHSSMESNKLTKILKRNVNLTNYEYPTKPISHTFTVLIYSLKKFQKMLFLRQCHKTTFIVHQLHFQWSNDSFVHLLFTYLHFLFHSKFV